tara:strand:- start:1944 stop:3029 length:1086 start_codon:yes stop_codon:yes gene_type:complete
MFLDHYKDKKVLITGHTGFKGSWLTLWLNKLGAKIAGFSIDIPTNPSLFDSLNIENDIDHNIGDILDIDSLSKVFDSFQPEIIFHLAAQPIVSESIKNPIDTYKTNIIGSANILECIRHSNSLKSAVMITSDKCYENVEWEYGYREIDSLGGKDPYSASKAGAEIIFSSYFRSFLKENETLGICTARAGNVIGGGDWAVDRIVPDTIKSWTSNVPAILRNPGSTRPWQHVLEPLSGYLLLAHKLYNNHSSINGSSFNFGPSSDVIKSVENLIDEMSQYWDGSSKDLPKKSKNYNESSLLKLNCDKALKELFWQPSLTFEETAKFTIDWYLANRNKNDIKSFTEKQIDIYQKNLFDRNKLLP